MTAAHVVALDRLLSLVRHEDFSGKDQSRERLRGDAMAGDGPFCTGTDTVEAA